jgi:phage FluMu protein Com
VKPDKGKHLKCKGCGKMGAETYHQRTQYVDKESNWTTLCPRCKKENDAYWDDMWIDYYANCM